MTTKVTTFPLRLTLSLKAAVEQRAKADGTSMNQFLAMAAVEKLASMKRRLSSAVTPTEPTRPGRWSLITSHWSSRRTWGRMGEPSVELTLHESKNGPRRKPPFLFDDKP